MYKSIKNKKINKKIKKKITQIIIKYNYIIGKKNIICINYLYISKNYSYIKIYINFLNIKNINIINNKKNKLQKLEKYIKNIIIKIKYFKYIKKIYFIYDNFIYKTNNLFKKIKNINKYIK